MTASASVNTHVHTNTTNRLPNIKRGDCQKHLRSLWKEILKAQQLGHWVVLNTDFKFLNCVSERESIMCTRTSTNVCVCAHMHTYTRAHECMMNINVLVAQKTTSDPLKLKWRRLLGRSSGKAIHMLVLDCFYGNLTAAGIIREGILIKEILLQTWPVGKPVGHFLDRWLCKKDQFTVGSVIPGLMVLGE